MSDNISITKRTKSRSLRTRSPSAQDDISTDTSAKPKPKHKSRLKPVARLSFGDDEENEGVFKMKKANLSQKITNEATVVSIPDTPTYSQEYLNELKARNRSAPTRSFVSDPDRYDMALDNESTDVDAIDSANTTIASDATIRAAKAQREMLRAALPSGDEYVALTSTGTQPASHTESRLIREDDEMGDEEDLAEYTGANDRISLGKRAKQEEEKRRLANITHMIEATEELDEESMEWELSQVKRGNNVDGVTESQPTSPGNTYRASIVPSDYKLPAIGSAIQALSSSLTGLTNAHATHATSLSALAKDRAAVELREAELRSQIDKEENKRVWFSAFQEWMENLAALLDEKFPQLEKLEAEHLSLFAERLQRITSRRRHEVENDLVSLLGPMRGRHSDTENTDDSSSVPRGESDEGYSSSSSSSLSPSEAVDYDIALGNLSAKKVKIMADVLAPEFRDPLLGVSRWFGEWRSRWEEIYLNAWGGLGLVATWEFWARLEMVDWNPFTDNRSLDSFEWYQGLYNYSHPAGPSDEGLDREVGPDGDLVSSMISLAVIPRLCKLVEGGTVDPYSARHMRRLVDLVDEVEATLGDDKNKIQALKGACITPFRVAVDSMVNNLASAQAQNLNRSDPEVAKASNRLLNFNVKLIDNLTTWRKVCGGQHGVDELLAQVLQRVVIPIAETVWEDYGANLIRKILSRYPTEFIPPDVLARVA